MVPLSDPAPRESAVAAMLGRRWSVERIALELQADEGFVEQVICDLTTKLMADPRSLVAHLLPHFAQDRRTERAAAPTLTARSNAES